jgi:subtilisin-like proprotein convertase family protein
MNSFRERPASRLYPDGRAHLFTFGVISLLYCASVVGAAPSSSTPANSELEPRVLQQIQLLHQEKLSRTPAQQKVGSQILYLLRQKRLGTVGVGLNALKPNLDTAPDGRVLVDLRATVSPLLLRLIQANGGLVINSYRRDNSIRALVPVELAETLAQRSDVRSVRPASRATTSAAIAYEGGNIAHRATEAREYFAADGTGVKIGVLSDSVDGLTDAQAAGALPNVTILPGQAGSGTGEGTAMLEIVHALAPGSQLFFATAFNGEANFADNIRSLHAAGCKIIIDDVTYFDESPFQDGPISQAVDDVSAAGVLYFSAAGNSGGIDRGTSGTWEGDFKDGGAATIGQGGRLHDFGGVTYNTVQAGIGFERLDLTWSDPLGQSTNDYDVYVLDNSGNVVSSSTDNQSGSTDPYETINLLNVGQRIVIVKYAGDSRFLHLSTGRGRLSFSTSGATYGHNASGATNAFCLAATRVASDPVPFVGGAANPVENFSSDGPRHVFYNRDGTPITPGDLSSTGGQVLQKPDFTAADGVATTVSGFLPFSGTSAAAPHAGAIAALLWSYNPFLSPADIRSVLTGTALTIGNPGFDRNSGAGIVMAFPALAGAPQAVLQSVQLQDANENGQLDPNECANLIVTLRNPSAQTLTGVTAILSSMTPDLLADPRPHQFPDVPPNQTAVAALPFEISSTPAFVCGSNATLQLQINTANLGTFVQPFTLTSSIAGLGNINAFASTNVPLDIPDMGTAESGIQVSGIVLPLAQVKVSAYITHTYDQDLRVSLVAPDNTEILLSANNGQSGQNYGAGCQQMTEFTDSAFTSIASASAPFLGTFSPEQPLSGLQGKSGAAVNGVWKLRVMDQAPQDVGTIQCWALELTPIGCLDGGGQCLSPPQLTQNISDQTVTNGSPAQFSVLATGSPPLSYQWYFNTNLALPGETNATLLITNTTIANAGVYQVIVSNVYGSLTSAPANLTVFVPVAIVTTPGNQVATNGDTVTLQVIAQGTPPISYQWFFEQTILPGETNSVLTLSNATPALDGSYQVVVSNAYACVTSSPATLRVLVLPTITCSPDLIVGVGFPWDFTAPAYTDTNLSFQLLGTTTNPICGQSFSATRQWLIVDTNGYQVTCSQTVQVVMTNPPVLACRLDKSVLSGQPWTFDAPTLPAGTESEALVYDNWTNNLNQLLDARGLELGNQITLEGVERYPTRFAVEYWGTNSAQADFSGTVTADIKFYQNDGVALPSGEATPGTVIFDSGVLPISATNLGALVVQDFQLDATVPLTQALPSNFTWTVTFAGLGQNDSAGLSLYGPPVIGAVASGYWISSTNGWTIGGSGQGFGAQLAAVNNGIYLSVVNTTTNAVCAQSFTATRTWQAVDACSNRTACSQTVTVLDHSAPLVLSQSNDLTVLETQTASIGLNVSSCPPVGFQWFFNQTNLLDLATNSTFVLSNLTLAQSGVYQAVVTNNYGSVTSAPINLTVVPPAVILTSPVAVVATNEDTVQFGITAQGTGPLSFQWFFDFTNALPQATNATLTLSNVVPAQAGTYQVIVSDNFGSVTSAPAQLTVLVRTVETNTAGPLAIPDLGSIDSPVLMSGLDSPLGRVEVGVYITHPYDADLKISLLSPNGAEVVLSTNNGQFGQDYGSNCASLTWFSDLATNSITTAAAPFVGAFQPQQPLSAFNGLSGSALNGLWTLRIADTGAQDSGSLQCWTLRLMPMGCPVDGGECLAAPQIVQDLSDQISTNGYDAHFGVLVSGTQPLTYQWFFNSTNLLALTTNAVLDLTNVSISQAGSYQVVVSNIYGIATSSVANLRVAIPAAIVSAPLDRVATNGDDVIFAVVAQGTLPLSYQWFFNSTNALPDATNSVLLLTNVTPAQAGSYQVLVANSYASATSAPANLVVRVLPRISCNPDLTVGVGAVWDFSPPLYVDTNLSIQVIGTATNALCGEGFRATRQWLVSDTNGYQVTCSQTVQVLDTNPPLLSCSSDKSAVKGTVWDFDVPAARDADAFEALVYDNWTNNLNQPIDVGTNELGNQITLDRTGRYLSRFALEYWGTNAVQQDFVGTAKAQVRFYYNDGPALITGQLAPGTIFYDSGPIAISATNQGELVIGEFNLTAAVPLQGPLPDSFTWTVNFSGLGSNDAAGLVLYGPPVAGQATNGYWIVQTNGWALQGESGQAFGGQLSALSSGVALTVVNTVTNSDCAGTFTATRTWQAQDACGNSSVCSQTVTVIDQSGPILLSQSSDESVLLGKTALVTVNVLSCPPVGYQWFFNSNTLPQATNSTLGLTNITSAQAGSYNAVITNLYGSVTSAPVTITVDVPAVVVGNPPNIVATNGDDVHWRVLAKGSAPVSYQWYFNLTNLLADATNSILDLTNVTPAQAGIYDVVVTNVFGSATSAPARLTIVVPPSLVTDLTDEVVTNGDTAGWTVLTQGTAPLAYQWFFNGGLLGLETNASLVISNVVAAQAGSYQVIVANAFGSVTSSPANLTVIVIPNIGCSSNLTVPIGASWDFTPPAITDTNLLVQILSTTTNTLCGNSYAAIREWLIIDTNGYEADCSQTVTVQDPAAPVLSCPGNKTVGYGSAWSFDVPTARESGATDAIVYDDLTNNLGQILDTAGVEVGNQVVLDGTDRYVSRFAVNYWATNANQAALSGAVTARVRFYYNNGPSLSTTISSPGTVFYDSGPLPVVATNAGTVELNEFQLTAAQPLQAALPSSFTWTIVFEGLGDQDSAGLNLFGPPTVGQAGSRYWAASTNGWTLQGQDGQSFGGQLAALSSGVAMSVVNTVTNMMCARSYTVTRSWQALDGCSNAALCSQTVSVYDTQPPAILNQPTDEVGVVSRDIAFSVGVACPAGSYQWYFNETNLLAFGTNQTLILTNLTFDAAGSYEVVVANANGSTTSSPALLTISSLPVISSQPSDLTVAGGDSASFSVSASGVPDPVYQWLFNATNVIVDATNSTLTLTNLQETQAGAYSVVVSNFAGSVTSTSAILTVLAAPIVIAQPQNQTVLQGQSVLLSVTAAGPGPLTYQWMANCTRPISGATANVLRLKNVAPSDSGNYCVVVSNSFGSVSSQSAVLRVLAQAKLTSVTESQNGVALSFSTVANLLYTVYSSDTAAGTNWTLLPDAFQQPGTGLPMTVHDSAAGSQRFYKIVVQ